MPFLRKILYILLALPLLAAPSCSSDDPDVPDAPSGPEVAGYLQLAVTTSGSSAYSRSNPTGGENGDGPEHGRNNENKIHNLSIFVYRDLGAGLDGDYPFVWTRDVDYQTIVDANPDHPYDGIYNVRIPLQEGEISNLRVAAGTTLRAVVVANAAVDLADQYSHATLSQLVKLTTYGSAWTGDTPAEADRFIMSTAFNGAKHRSQDGRIVVAGSSTQDGTIFSCNVSLERVAARIDFQVTKQNIDGDGNGGLLYNVKDTDHKVRLLNIIPVNLMKNPSFLVKHVTPGTGTREEMRNTDFLIAGDETLSGGIPSNYVWTPDFYDKPREDAKSLYTNPASELRKKQDYDLAYMSELTLEFLKTAYKFEGAGENERSIILTYANENTHHSDIQEIHTDFLPSDYLTGLLFRARYIPDKVYTSGLVGDDAPVKTAAQRWERDDFWMFRRLAVEGVKEAGNLYFDSEQHLNDYIAANAADLEPGREYRTAKFTEGICYYNVWIKHANVDEVDNIPMMYGIVRNNIYRLSVTFSNIGLPTPDIQEPHRNIDFVIDVVPWVSGGKVHIPME